MKKTFLLLFVFSFFFILFGCSNVTKSLDITYVLNNGSSDVEYSYDSREDITLLSGITKKGYEFEGWYLDKELTESMTDEQLKELSQKEVTLYANWTIGSYTVSYYSDGDLFIQEVYNYLESIVPLGDNPTKEGYSFDGWDITVPAKMLGSDLTLNAVYTPNSYDITYHNVYSSQTVKGTYLYGSTLDLLSVYHLASSFEGWYLDENFETLFTDTTMPASDFDLYAKWSANLFNIHFELLNGATLADEEVTFQEIISALPIITDAEYQFEGWSYFGELIEYPFTFNYLSDITVEAIWTVTVNDTVYQIKGDHAEVIGYTGTATTLTLQDQIDDLDVTIVANSAFQGNTTLVEVSLGQYVTTVSDSAFADMPNLEKIAFADTTLSFGMNTLFNTPSLQEITISGSFSREIDYLFGSKDENVPSSLTTIQLTDGTDELNSAFGQSFGYLSITVALPETWTTIPAYAFRGWMMNSVWIPSSVEVIEEYAFLEARKLREIVFEEGSQLSTIQAYAFCDSAVSSISLPATVTNIEAGAFSRANSLVSIAIPSENAYYTVMNDVLYTKSLDKIIAYPSGLANQSFTLPASVETIGGYAFYNNAYLEEILFPENSLLTSIERRGFYGASSVRELVIPDSVTSIGDQAFASCYSLNKIYLSSHIVYVGENQFSMTFELSAVYTDGDTIPSTWDEDWNETGIDIVFEYFEEIIVDHVLYAISSGGNAYLIRVTEDFSATTFTVPNTVDNKPVVSISANAFNGKDFLESITISNTVKSIGNYAFINCDALDEIIFEENSTLELIGMAAFYNSSIESVVLPDSIQRIDDFSFANNLSLIQIYIPDGISYIGQYIVHDDYHVTVFLEGTVSEGFSEYWNIQSSMVLFNQVNPELGTNDSWVYPTE